MADKLAWIEGDAVVLPKQGQGAGEVQKIPISELQDTESVKRWFDELEQTDWFTPFQAIELAALIEGLMSDNGTAGG